MTAPALGPEDILSLFEYGAHRAEHRRRLAALRQRRRVLVGPFVALSFECRDTIWHQIQEMLFIEKGGTEQVAEELAAYNPLVPNGSELVATLMIEIDDAARRERSLSELGGIEHAVSLRFAGTSAAAVPEDDVERTRADGKTSAVHFLHFPLTKAQSDAFRTPGCEVVLAIAHPAYRHMAVLSEEQRQTLAADLAS